jgi:hypothetical protein
VSCWADEERPCAGSDTLEHREYTRFRLEVTEQAWVLVGEEERDRETRRRFGALPRAERLASLEWWKARMLRAIALDYWTLLRAAADNYAGLRGVHESSCVFEDSRENDDAAPRSGWPPALPSGTRMLFGEYHGRGLPSAAELKDCIVPVGMSLYETTTEKRYVYTREDGSHNSVPPEYVDWRRS